MRLYKSWLNKDGETTFEICDGIQIVAKTKFPGKLFKMRIGSFSIAEVDEDIESELKQDLIDEIQSTNDKNLETQKEIEKLELKRSRGLKIDLLLLKSLKDKHEYRRKKNIHKMGILRR